jgi:membrane-bound metal-dependent hydrolase YbcI (DUF457 family)
MANFQTHITTSTVLGVIYGVTGIVLGVPITSSIIAGGLCSLAGMLPDLDSDSGIPVRETTNLASAIVPILLLDRFSMMGLGHEEMIVAAGGVYLIMRFGVAKIFKNFTVHRGMWHSIPAAIIASALGFMLCSCHSATMQWYKAGGVFIGFMSHLILDELNSLEFKIGRIRIKRSFGTAFKLWGRKAWPNISTYGKLVIVLLLAFGDRMYFSRFIEQNQERFRVAREFMGDIHSQVERFDSDDHDSHTHGQETAPTDPQPRVRNRDVLMRR